MPRLPPRCFLKNFNPHEREARDRRRRWRARSLRHFNPHEREARDGLAHHNYKASLILIHTSVKLVTRAFKARPALILF